MHACSFRNDGAAVMQYAANDGRKCYAKRETMRNEKANFCPERLGMSIDNNKHTGE